MKRKYLRRIFVISAVLIILLFAFDTRLKCVTYNLKSSEITDEVRLVLVTDLHSCHYGDNQSELFDEIEPYNPDAVLLGGDIFDDVLDDGNAKVFISGLTEKYKTYYVSGNHEWWSNKMYDFFGFLEDNNVTVLRGASDVLQIGENTVTISGIDDPEVSRYDDTYADWEEQLGQAGNAIETERFNILLTHRPERAEQYSMYDFDLVLSGHAHGGQFRIPYIMNGFFAPDQGFFPELAGGEYDFGGQKLIVSRGLALESTRLPRIFNRPELIFITVSPE